MDFQFFFIFYDLAGMGTYFATKNSEKAKHPRICLTFGGNMPYYPPPPYYTKFLCTSEKPLPFLAFIHIIILLVFIPPHIVSLFD